MKLLRFILIFFLFCASIGMLFVSISSGQAGGGNIFCSNVFPGTCTQGGCGAQAGWQAEDCVIRCTVDPKTGFWNTISCKRPQAN